MKFHCNLPPLGPFVLLIGSPIGFCPLIIRSTSKLSSALSTPVGSEINIKRNVFWYFPYRHTQKTLLHSFLKIEWDEELRLILTEEFCLHPILIYPSFPRRRLILPIEWPKILRKNLDLHSFPTRRSSDLVSCVPVGKRPDRKSVV